jgi:hypothetical protein
MQIRRLIVEVDEGARKERGLHDERGSRPAAQLETQAAPGHGRAGEVPGNWPYLAI